MNNKPEIIESIIYSGDKHVLFWNANELGLIYYI
jgi:hypothetical protein